jgi:hypothetical protein
VKKSYLTLGNTDRDIEVPPKELPIEGIFSNPDVTKLLLRIKGQQFLVDVQEILKFSLKIDELSDYDIEGKMEEISSWAHTMSSANADIKVERKALSREYERWKSQKIKEYRNKILERDPADTRIFREVLLDDKNNKEYEEYQSLLDRYDAMSEKMTNFYDIILKRNETLRSILKRRDFKGDRGRQHTT